MKRAPALLYVITAHRKREGVVLAKRGHWGNIPYPDAEAAERAARADANGHPLAIERVRH